MIRLHTGIEIAKYLQLELSQVVATFVYACMFFFNFVLKLISFVLKLPCAGSTYHMISLIGLDKGYGASLLY